MKAYSAYRWSQKPQNSQAVSISCQPGSVLAATWPPEVKRCGRAMPGPHMHRRQHTKTGLLPQKLCRSHLTIWGSLPTDLWLLLSCCGRYKENTSFKAIMIDEDLQSTIPRTSPHTTVSTCRTGIRSLPPALKPLPVMSISWERNWVV